MKHKDLLLQHLLYLSFGFTMKINLIFCSISDLEREAATGQDIGTNMPLRTTREWIYSESTAADSKIIFTQLM